ncbi:MAG TPA: GNAT family N-acetyltransferase [Streptosporangiaceae bacterium]|nr:GNAT family N-acetyltransferase [Streptosporangiaceae bacterium]
MALRPEELIVGRVSPDQWTTYREVRLTALTDSPEAFSSTLERELEFPEQLWRDRIGSNIGLLAWQADRPVGTVAVLSTEIADTHGFTGAWHLVGMWVSPTARRLGVGARLVEAAADAARSGSAPALLLWVVESNDAARTLYERQGFVATDVRQAHPNQPGEREQLMVRELA